MSKFRTAYEKYLLSDHWASLRRAKFQQVGKKCQNCNHPQSLHVHHIRYRDLLDVKLDDLIVFCNLCHETLHTALKYYGIKVSQCELVEACEIIKSWLANPKAETRSWRKKDGKKRKQHRERMDNSTRVVNHRGPCLNRQDVRFVKRAYGNFRQSYFAINQLEQFIQELTALWHLRKHLNQPLNTLTLDP